MSHVAPLRAPDRAEPVASVERLLAIDQLQHAADCQPDAIFRAGQGLTYAEAWARTGAIASWLIAQGFGPQSAPVALLSDDSLERALFIFGALRAGVLALPPDYSLPGDLTGLDHALDVVEPGLVFAQDSAAHRAALDRAQARGARIVTVDGKRGLAFAALASCSIDAAVSERRLHIAADTPARILFVPGPTGLPTSLLSTHGDLADLQVIVAGGSG